MKIFYNKKLKQLARELRKNSILSEILLWNVLKSRKMRGYQFMRQKPINRFIVDFYCSKLKLIIEIDGNSHDFLGKEDNQRQYALEAMNLSFLRFTDEDVKKNIDGIITSIEEYIIKHENRLT